MDKDTSWLLAQISVFSGLLPATVAIINRKYATSIQKILFLLVSITLLVEIVAYVFAGLFSINNMLIFHIYTFVELLLLGLIYQKELKSTIRPNFFRSLIMLFFIFAVFNSLFIETIFQFNAKARAVSSLLIIFFALSYFYQLLKEVKIKKLEREPMFWLSIGLLIYFSSSFFIFIFSNYIAPSVKLSFTFWGIHALLNISLMIFYTIALWVKPQSKT